MTIRFIVVSAVAIVLAQSAQTVWDSVYSDAQATRGQAVYSDRCASCHADNLSGIDQAAPLVGADFTSEWNDQSVKDLFERIRISMPADKPGSLERQQVADVLAFILKKNAFPAGSSELPTVIEPLAAIKILAKKP